MEILPGIEMVDLALHIKQHQVVVFSDLHIGYEEALNKQGVMVPRFQYADVRNRLGRILARTKPEQIVVNGDIKHEFGTITEQEWRETLKVLDFLGCHAPVTLIRGNHDTILGPIAKKREVRTEDELVVGDVQMVHGHRLVDVPGKVKTIIIGHEHPALSLSDAVRSETYKCFLLGSYKGKDLIVLPSLNLAVEGTDIQRDEILSPYLKQELGGFQVFVVGEKEILPFGPLGRL
jgi:putative SbcD/Mre11-related phosphoesterase